MVLIGPSGCGKSSFARKHFKATEVLSSDFCRGLVSDDENDQAATKDAFDVLHFIARKRLAAARLTVVDATNVQPEARKPLVELAREFHVLPVAIVLNMPERLCQERNRIVPTGSLVRTWFEISRSSCGDRFAAWSEKDFGMSFVLTSPEEVAAVRSRGRRFGTIARTNMGRSTSLAMCMGAMRN